MNLRGRSHLFCLSSALLTWQQHAEQKPPWWSFRGHVQMFYLAFLNHGTTMSRDHTAHLYVMVQQNNAATASLLGCVESETQFYPIESSANAHTDSPSLFLTFALIYNKQIQNQHWTAVKSSRQNKTDGLYHRPERADRFIILQFYEYLTRTYQPIERRSSLCPITLISTSFIWLVDNIFYFMFQS